MENNNLFTNNNILSNRNDKTLLPELNLYPHVSKEKLLNPVLIKNTKSKICCHGRPSTKDITIFKEKYGVNYIISLLNQNEKPEEIEKMCLDNQISWELIEVNGANYIKKSENKKIISKLLNLYEKLLSEEIILFVHCAAGIHRTGTIIYTLLRMFGEDRNSAYNILGEIRKETKNKVGDFRIKLAEEKLVSVILEEIKK
jgi:protein-tyrosine phosphatase